MKPKVAEWVDSEAKRGKGNQGDKYSKERRMKQWQVGEQKSSKFGVTVENHYQSTFW